MESLPKDMVHYIANDLSIKDIVQLSMVSKTLYKHTKRYRSLKHARKWFGRLKIKSDAVLLLAAINVDWKLIHYSIERGAKNWKTAYDNSRDKKVKEFFDAKFFDVNGIEYLNIKKFDLTDMTCSKVCVIGNSGRVRGCLIKDLLYHEKDKHDVGIIMTAGLEEEYAGIVPDLFIYNNFDENVVRKIVKRQKKFIKAQKKSSSFIVFDGVFDEASILSKSKPVTNLLKYGRSYNITQIYSTQYCLGIPPSLRMCIDYVFILKENNMNNKKRLWNNYGNIVPTFQMFCDIMDNLTQNYGCMVINNRSLSNKIEDNIFWYKSFRTKFY